MPMSNISLQNIIGGVSTQTPTVRYPNQVAVMTNMVADPVKGLHKRPNTEHVISEKHDSNTKELGTHLFKDSKGEIRFLRITYNPTTKVNYYEIIGRDSIGNINTYDILDKDDKPIKGGLASYFYKYYDDKSDLEFMTIGDTVYILNKSKQIALTGTDYQLVGGRNPTPTASNAPYVGFIWFKSGAYSSTFDIEINGKRNKIETKGSLHDTTSEARNAEKGADVNTLTTNLYNMIVSGTTPSNTLYASSSVNRLNDADTYLRLVGNVIWIYGMNALNIVNHGNQTNVEVASGSVAQISDLPPLSGYNWGNDEPYITVAGDNTKAEDDYVMRYIKGVWTESVPPNSSNALLNHGAIVMLKKEFDSSGKERWRATEMSFAKRKVGNDTTNPQPSFIGNKINGMFTHNNRFGLISGENLIMAESGEYIKPNFWNKTTLTSLDTDPIDIAVATDEINALHSVIQLSNKLLAFSDNAQFVLEGDTPLNTKFYKTTSYDNNPKVKPLGHGSFVYFVDSQNNVWEMATNNITDTTVAVDITSHIRGYIDKPITRIVGDTENKQILIVCGNPDRELYDYGRYTGSIYVYRYLYVYTNQGLQKQQSAWGKWEFPVKLQDAFIIKGTIYTVNHGTGFIPPKSGSSTAHSQLVMVNEMKMDGYNNLTLLDNIRPITHANDKRYISQSKLDSGETMLLNRNYEPAKVSDFDAYLASGVSDGRTFYYGYTYDSSVELSPIYIKGKPQIGISYKRMFINYEDTAYFDVSVDFKGRKQERSFSNLFINKDKLDRVTTTDGIYEFLTFGDNKNTKIKISSKEPYNFSVQSITFSVRVTERRGG